MSSLARRVLVSGLVQGVAFRYYACTRADELGVSGWIRNLRDGRVEAQIEGDPIAVEAMQAWLGLGPSAARVEAIVANDVECVGRVGFQVVP